MHGNEIVYSEAKRQSVETVRVKSDGKETREYRKMGTIKDKSGSAKKEKRGECYVVRAFITGSSSR